MDEQVKATDMLGFVVNVHPNMTAIVDCVTVREDYKKVEGKEPLDSDYQFKLVTFAEVKKEYSGVTTVSTELIVLEDSYRLDQLECVSSIDARLMLKLCLLIKNRLKKQYAEVEFLFDAVGRTYPKEYKSLVEEVRERNKNDRKNI